MSKCGAICEVFSFGDNLFSKRRIRRRKCYLFFTEKLNHLFSHMTMC